MCAVCSLGLMMSMDSQSFSRSGNMNLRSQDNSMTTIAIHTPSRTTCLAAAKKKEEIEENCSSYKQQPLRRKWIFLYCVESPGRIIYATTILGAYAYVDLGNHYMLTESPLNHVDTFL